MRGPARKSPLKRLGCPKLTLHRKNRPPAVQVPSHFSTGTLPLQYRYPPASVQVPSRFSTAAIPRARVLIIVIAYSLQTLFLNARTAAIQSSGVVISPAPDHVAPAQ